jgi:hypothetical protein
VSNSSSPRVLQQTNKKRTSRRGQRSTSNQNQLDRSISPPSIRPNIQITHKFRFSSDASASATITNQNLLTAAGCKVTTNNSTATSVWMAVKILSIEVWSIPEGGATSNCSVVWKGDSSLAGINNLEVSDTSLSPTHPAHLVARPPRGTLPSFWYGGGFAENLFTVSVDGTGILDVTLALILGDAPTSAYATLTIASGSLGTNVYSALDGSTDKFTPVGLTTTT